MAPIRWPSTSGSASQPALSSIHFDAVTTAASTLVGSTVSLTATLWANGAPTGLSCTATPPLTGIVAIGTELGCDATLAPAVIPAGSPTFIAVPATVIAGLDLATTISANVSTGIS